MNLAVFAGLKYCTAFLVESFELLRDKVAVLFFQATLQRVWLLCFSSSEWHQLALIAVQHPDLSQHTATVRLSSSWKECTL